MGKLECLRFPARKFLNHESLSNKDMLILDSYPS